MTENKKRKIEAGDARDRIDMTDVPFDKDAEFAKIGVKIPDILLPKLMTERWPVVACDQFSSQIAYWRQAEALVGEEPSSLRLIAPEAYLYSDDFCERVRSTGEFAQKYIETGVFAKPITGFVYVERRLAGGGVRRGLVIALDLDMYDYRPGAPSMIRATEETVPDRLPPRVRIRGVSPLELPHAIALYDDPRDALTEYLISIKDEKSKLYDIELSQGGGRATGYVVQDDESLSRVSKILASLVNGGLLFAVGDGNHSLAAAKSHWDALREGGAVDGDHPARYALVEIENIHDEANVFEPIHRAVLGDGTPGWEKDILAFFKDRGYVDTVENCGGGADGENAPRISFTFPTILPGGRKSSLTIERPNRALCVAQLQSELDEWARARPDARIEYIHGEEELKRLAIEEGNLCFVLPAIDKTALFAEVASGGVLPRKAFSMGRAQDKRYYIEARRIAL